MYISICSICNISICNIAPRRLNVMTLQATYALMLTLFILLWSCKISSACQLWINTPQSHFSTWKIIYYSSCCDVSHILPVGFVWSVECFGPLLDGVPLCEPGSRSVGKNGLIISDNLGPLIFHLPTLGRPPITMDPLNYWLLHPSPPLLFSSRAYCWDLGQGFTPPYAKFQPVSTGWRNMLVITVYYLPRKLLFHCRSSKLCFLTNIVIL